MQDNFVRGHLGVVQASCWTSRPATIGLEITTASETWTAPRDTTRGQSFVQIGTVATLAAEAG